MPDKEPKTATVIALCGKGGVGKTSISAMTVRILLENPENRVLAIDADPAIGLATALGVEVRKTVDDIRNDLIERMESGDSEGKAETLIRLDYEMFSALGENNNLAFLAIGRPETEGCYCQVNHILKDIIASMADNFDYVVIDGEAGVEQVNRRVMERVSHLILVSDASKKGLNVSQTIKTVSDSVIDFEQAGLIVNRLKGQKECDNLFVAPELNFLGWIPEDDIVRSFDIKGKSILDAPECRAVKASKTCLTRLGIPGGHVQSQAAAQGRFVNKET